LALGTGLGTYPRLWYDRAPPLEGPSNIRAGHDDVGQYGAVPIVTLQTRRPLFFVQKLAVAQGTPLHLAFRIRAHTPGAALGVGLCGKWLLYSLDCTTAAHRVTAPNVWESVSLSLIAPRFPTHPRVPIELYLAASPPGTEIDLAALRLTDDTGAEHLRNGDFSAGTTHWFFTDDNHVLWRIFNQYLTSFFEAGLLGAFAFVLLLATAASACLRALGRGEREAACLAGALAAFAVSCLFDAPLEVPRLAVLFYLLAFTALGLWRAPVPHSRALGLVQPETAETAETGGTGGTAQDILKSEQNITHRPTGRRQI